MLAGGPCGGFPLPPARRGPPPERHRARAPPPPRAAERLWRGVYAGLRKLAAQKWAKEKPGQTREATALVHEASLRLVDAEQAQQWNSRGHFFAAAAEAMRRILVDNARRKRSLK